MREDAESLSAYCKGERAANPRLQKCVYWRAYAEEQGSKPEAVLDEAAELNKTKGTPCVGFLDLFCALVIECIIALPIGVSILSFYYSGTVASLPIPSPRAPIKPTGQVQ